MMETRGDVLVRRLYQAMGSARQNHLDWVAGRGWVVCGERGG